MATSTPINIITGRTGTAHVSSSDDAAIWRGLVGNDNVTLSTDQSLALDYSTKGSLVLSDGVLCVGGRMGRISNTSTVTYNLPSSGYYRRTLLIVRYAFDSSDDTESMTLMVLQNDPASDTSGSGGAAAAAELTIVTNPSTDYILYDFVCDEDGVVSGTIKTELTVVDTIPILRSAIDEVDQNRMVHEYNGEKSSVDTGDAYYSFENTASTILNESKIAVIKLWQMNESGMKSAVCIWVKSSNLESYWRTAPVLMDVNGEQTLVVFQISLQTSGTNSGALACRCVTSRNGSTVIHPQNIPFDRVTIFSWR